MQTTVFDPLFPVLCEYEDEILINNANPLIMELQTKSHAYNVTSPPIFWTKRPQKIHYNKEIWQKKTNPVLNGQLVRNKPEVINIIKRLLPENLPSKLSSLLKNGIDRSSFNPMKYYNIPSANKSNVVSTTSDSYEIMSSTTSTAARSSPIKKAIHQSKSPKWKPWYLGGGKV
uniref:Uncharacterized protein n=1 Tax=Heterorhabditis bacteriophora TaxID=37862 RepID=A0A1I7WL89_HETBA